MFRFQRIRLCFRFRLRRSGCAEAGCLPIGYREGTTMSVAAFLYLCTAADAESALRQTRLRLMMEDDSGPWDGSRFAILNKDPDFRPEWVLVEDAAEEVAARLERDGCDRVYDELGEVLSERQTVLQALHSADGGPGREIAVCEAMLLLQDERIANPDGPVGIRRLGPDHWALFGFGRC